MEHVVFYPSFDGSPAFRRVASLEDAARFVEHLRNVEDVTDFSVHALTAVPLSVRPWYRVEVPFDAQGEVAAPVPAEVAPAVPAPAEAPIAEMPIATPAAMPDAVMPEAVMPMPESPAAVMPAPVEPQQVEPTEQVEPMTPELAEAVAGGRRTMGFFTR